ncbi:GyrI-like domain-containing protein [Microbacter margulisiae]|uniref:GyrI-like small molecule binding domain-containing protein n=1 Tax=Microbacter margulisiae TaxID=1350067 RepID=A0A7W5DRU0_9PORP|nr:GyrI-like domain-containing protein [Microbacter margulisiae]MBB3187404.1 hypothetical protein [Microbacter margulisiae]
MPLFLCNYVGNAFREPSTEIDDYLCNETDNAAIMAKRDFKKELKAIYDCPAITPVSVTIPGMNYLMIDGQGNPNTSPAYQEAIETLFSVSYTLKFMIKKAPNGSDYGVLPLESLWWTENGMPPDMEHKELWHWTAMIMQPEFITKELLDEAIKQIKTKKKDLPALQKMRFEYFEEGACVQIMHIGPYAAEQPTITQLYEFMAQKDVGFNGKHHEIYLSDIRKASPEKLKTIIRQPVRPR